MTDLITEARELCERATPGPWKSGSYGSVCLKSGFNLGNIEGTWNAAFIARSRTLIPELCDALEKAEAANAWIPVTEQLPTERRYYLTIVKRIAPDELGGNNTRAKIMRWMGEDWRYPVHIPEWINEAITETVTHWMPLPAPPEEGAEHE